MVTAGLIYALGLVVVAAALQHELESKPRATAAAILLWPIALPLAAIAGGIGALIRR